eukprot:2832286-Prymnesium_polylepis.1
MWQGVGCDPMPSARGEQRWRRAHVARRGEQKWRARLLFTGLLHLRWRPAGPPRGCVQARCGAERARAGRPLRKGGSLPFHQG